mmetsp:Transcript_6869/g.9887  ORF Transcript_6869/g.9887 Transcript_6869/m.9887 type:complete len:236 (-) Transcript_6869:352-1059(-)
MMYQSFFSMPHSIYIFLPLSTAMASLFFSLRSLLSCDLVETTWVIKCGGVDSYPCAYITEVGLGLRGRNYVENLTLDNDGEIYESSLPVPKICHLYDVEEEKWLIDNIWNICKASEFICVVIGAILIIILVLTSCFTFKHAVFSFIGLLELCLSVLNASPLLLLVRSKVCSADKPLCDPMEIYCVDSCQLGKSGYFLITGSIFSLSCSIATLTIPFLQRKKQMKNKVKTNFECQA